MADVSVPRRRRWRRRLVIAIFVLAGLIFFAPVIAGRCGVVQSFVAKALDDFDGTVTIGSASLGWFSPVELDNVTVADAQGRTMLNAPKMITSKTLFGLLTDSANLGTVTLERPVATIVCERDTTNLESSLARLLDKPRGGKLPTLLIEASGASVTVMDAGQEWSFTEVGVVADVGDTIRLRLNVPEQLACDFTVMPQFAATIDAAAFPIEAAGPFLRRFEPGLDLAGKLSGQALTSGNRVEGDLRIDNFAATSPRLGSERIAFDSVRLPFRVQSEGSKIAVELAKLTCPVAEVTFVGTIDTADMESLAQQPGVNASLQLDVAKLAKLVPKSMQLKPGTELSDGRVEVHLASKAGGVWNGQFKASGLKGQRDGQPLAWEQPVIATFAGRIDDKYRPDFESLIVAADFARIDAKGTLEHLTADAEISLDKLAVQLAKFVDLSGVQLAGKAVVHVSPGAGNDHTLQVRLQKLVASAPAWQFAGDGTFDAQAAYRNQTLILRGVQGDLKDVRFRGPGVDLDEPMVKVLDSQLDYDFNTRQTSIAKLQLTTQTIAIGAQSDPAADATSRPIEASITANLARLQRTLQIPGEPMSGILRAKLVSTVTTARQSGTVSATISDFRYGPPADPLWAEPELRLALDGNLTADLLTLTSAKLDTLHGASAVAKGTLRNAGGKPTLDLTGDLTYDFDKLQPRLKSLLGASFQARGSGTKPFQLQGSIESPTLLVGDASLAWQSLAAYGFDVGASQINAKIESGTLTTTPIEANFGSTGKVKLEPTIRFQPNTFDLTFQKGRVIEKATLTPAACAEAIGFALPAIAKATNAEGTISFDLEENRLLLMDIARSTLKGKLTLHDVTVSGGPVITEVARLFGEENAKLILAKEQAVGIRIENGRVYHESLKLASHGFTVTTSGSVGFDGTLSLTAEVPLPEKSIGPLLKGVPKIRDAVMNKRLTITITGTLGQPRLDKRAFEAEVATFIRDVTRDAARGKLQDLFQKGLEKAVPKKP